MRVLPSEPGSFRPTLQGAALFTMGILTWKSVIWFCRGIPLIKLPLGKTVSSARCEKGNLGSYTFILIEWVCNDFYRAWLKGGPQDWLILILLLITTSAWLCLQHSRNLGTLFLAKACKMKLTKLRKSFWQTISIPNVANFSSGILCLLEILMKLNSIRIRPALAWIRRCTMPHLQSLLSGWLTTSVEVPTVSWWPLQVSFL